MPRPYSNDLRERVVYAVECDQTCRAVAERFGVSVSSVVKWSGRHCQTGSVKPSQMGGYRSVLLAAHRTFVHRCFAEEPELTLRGLQRKLADKGIKVSYGAIWRFVHAEGLSFKKTALASEQNRPDVARRRRQWKKYQGRVDPSRLIFIDETWAKTNMAPLRGWTPRGERLTGRAPHGRWRTQTFLAGLRNDRLTAPCVFDGPINGERFLAYVTQVLVPTLSSGDIVIILLGVCCAIACQAAGQSGQPQIKGRSERHSRCRCASILPAALLA